MSWQTLTPQVNAAMLAVFGEPVAYYPNHGAGDPVSISAIRVRRSPDEFNPVGAFEGIEIQESDFVDLPVTGDVVILDGIEYVISNIRNPDPTSGTQTLILSRRTALPPTP